MKIKPVKAWAVVRKGEIRLTEWMGHKRVPWLFRTKQVAEGWACKEDAVITVLIVPITKRRPHGKRKTK